jgi:phosphatidate cytidylyltransferase
MMETQDIDPSSEKSEAPLASRWSDLLHRFWSSLAIVAIVILALLWNAKVFSGVFIAIGLWIFVEWCNLTDVKPKVLVLIIGLSGLALGSGIGAFCGHWGIALSVLVATLGGLLYSAQDKRDQFWTCLGLIYGGSIAFALVYLRHRPVVGFSIVCWILVIVAAVDTMAFFTGRLFGGAKVLPHISPNKTWSGVLGGTLSGTLAGVICLVLAKMWGVPLEMGYSRLVYLSFFGAIISQCGDFFESYLKRYMGVKNTGNVIPGHGGLMDRFDSLCMLSFCTFLVFAFHRIVY